MRRHLQSFGQEFALPVSPLIRVEYPQQRVRLAIPAGWIQIAPFSFGSPDNTALLVFSPLMLRGPMDAHAAAALFAESSGLHPLAFRQLGSRDDAETLCRCPDSKSKLTLLRVVQIGAATWAVRAQWDAAAQNPADMATLRASVLSFHGDADPALSPVQSTINLMWDRATVPVPCPVGWQPEKPCPGGPIRLRPVDGSDAYLRVDTFPPDFTAPTIFKLWRTELERAGYQVFGAPIIRQPNSPTSSVLLMAEKNGKLFEAPMALSEFVEGSVLLSCLAPSWLSSPETAGLTHRAFADFALAIQESVQRA